MVGLDYGVRVMNPDLYDPSLQNINYEEELTYIENQIQDAGTFINIAFGTPIPDDIIWMLEDQEDGEDYFEY